MAPKSSLSENFYTSPKLWESHFQMEYNIYFHLNNSPVFFSQVKVRRVILSLVQEKSETSSESETWF